MLNSTSRLASSLGCVRASDVPFLALEKKLKAAADQVVAEVAKATQRIGVNPSFWVVAAWRMAQHMPINTLKLGGDLARAPLRCATQF